jgi:hypothetical protein
LQVHGVLSNKPKKWKTCILAEAAILLLQTKNEGYTYIFTDEKKESEKKKKKNRKNKNKKKRKKRGKKNRLDISGNTPQPLGKSVQSSGVLEDALFYVFLAKYENKYHALKLDDVSAKYPLFY